MTRSRATAKQAGAAFERLIADHLKAALNDDRIDRRTRNGAKDRGDIGGLVHMGQRIVVEVKNTARWEPGAWLTEAETERRNDDAGVAMVIAKRHGKGQPGDQVVLMTVRDLTALLTGSRSE